MTITLGLTPDLRTELAALRARTLYGATIPDAPAPLLPCATDTTVVARVRAISTLFAAVEATRETLAIDVLDAQLAADDIERETRVHLAAALHPDITYADVNAFVHDVFAIAADSPHRYGAAAALAAAALRGWAQRTALAGGGA